MIQQNLAKNEGFLPQENEPSRQWLLLRNDCERGVYAYACEVGLSRSKVSFIDPDGRNPLAIGAVIGLAVYFLLSDEDIANAPWPNDDVYSTDPYVDTLGKAGLMTAAATAYDLLRLVEKLDQPKCPDGPRPPGWNEDWEHMFGSRGDEERWFDPEGGEWRWYESDSFHDEGHWDYFPNDEWNSGHNRIDRNGNPLP
jgi:hypothetical protein